MSIQYIPYVSKLMPYHVSVVHEIKAVDKGKRVQDFDCSALQKVEENNSGQVFF